MRAMVVRALAGLILIAGTAVPAHPQQIEGVVRNADGDPIADASVVCSWTARGSWYGAR